MSDTPRQLIEAAVEPNTRSDQDLLGTALVQLAAEDPSFGFVTERESGQIIIRVTDERHLQAIVNRLRQDLKVGVNFRTPQVAYRESLTRKLEIDYTHKKLTGAAGQFARVKLRFEPQPYNSGF